VIVLLGGHVDRVGLVSGDGEVALDWALDPEAPSVGRDFLKVLLAGPIAGRLAGFEDEEATRRLIFDIAAARILGSEPSGLDLPPGAMIAARTSLALAAFDVERARVERARALKRVRAMLRPNLSEVKRIAETILRGDEVTGAMVMAVLSSEPPIPDAGEPAHRPSIGDASLPRWAWSESTPPAAD
jgi:hypothetical protein